MAEHPLSKREVVGSNPTGGLHFVCYEKFVGAVMDFDRSSLGIALFAMNDALISVNWAHGVVVSHPLRMRKALGSNPSGSMFAKGLSCYLFCI